MAKKTKVEVHDIDYQEATVDTKYQLGELIETIQFYWPDAVITVTTAEVSDDDADS